MNYPINISKLWFSYPGKNYILKGIDLTVKEGEAVSLLGLSGCGKSTLCYCMCGVIPHVYQGDLKGDILIQGISTRKLKLPSIATRLGIVFQNPDTQLFSPIVEDEIAFAPENLCLEMDEIGSRIYEALSLINMKKHRFDAPHHLSGGQKQLIAFASVLSLKPGIMILDEVMSHIDGEGKKLIKETIMGLKKAGKTLVMVEHDLNNLDMADRVLVLKDGNLEKFKGDI